MDETDIRLINECFDGDEHLYKQSLEDAQMETIHWSDLEVSNKVFPDLENAALILIKERLGYIPPKSVTQPYEPFIRTLIYQYHNKLIDFPLLISNANDFISLMNVNDINDF